MLQLRIDTPWLKVLQVLIGIVVSHRLWAQETTSVGTVDVYPTFEAAGVFVAITGDDNLNATAALEVCEAGTSDFTTAHPLVRLYGDAMRKEPAQRFGGSLLGLAPGKSYAVRVTLTDPDGVTQPAPASACTGAAGATEFTTWSDVTDDPRAVCSGLRLPPGPLVYVSPEGCDDPTSGSVAQPFQTIDYAIRTMIRDVYADASAVGDEVAGTTVCVRPGVYRESVFVGYVGLGDSDKAAAYRAAAASTGPIALVAMTDLGAVVLDGSQEELATGIVAWEETDSAGVYRTPQPGSDVGTFSYVAFGPDPISAARLYPFPSLTELLSASTEGTDANGKRVPVVVPGGGWFADRDFLYVRLANESDPTGQPVYVATHNQGLWLEEVMDVDVSGFELRGFGTDPTYGDGKGIYINGSEQVTVRDVMVHHVLRGVAVRSSAHVTVQDSTVFDVGVTDWPWEAVKYTSAEGFGIEVSNWSQESGVVVRRNHVHGLFNGIAASWNSYQDGALVAPTGSSEIDVYANTIEDISDDAIEIEPRGINIRVWQNRIRHVFMPLSAAPVEIGPTYILRNVVEAYGDVVSSRLGLRPTPATALKLNNGFGTVTGPIFVYHNTFVAAPAFVNGETTVLTDGLLLMSPGSWTGLVMRNNIFLASGFAMHDQSAWLGRSFSALVDMDYDNLFSSDPERFYARVDPNGPSWELIFLDEFQCELAMELHGHAVDPELVDGTAGLLSSTSCLIDQGLLIPGINQTFQGAAPDIGAAEQEGEPAQCEDRLSPDGGTEVDMGVPDAGVVAVDANGMAHSSTMGTGGCSCQLGWAQ